MKFQVTCGFNTEGEARAFAYIVADLCETITLSAALKLDEENKAAVLRRPPRGKDTAPRKYPAPHQKADYRRPASERDSGKFVLDIVRSFPKGAVFEVGDVRPQMTAKGYAANTPASILSALYLEGVLRRVGTGRYILNE